MIEFFSETDFKLSNTESISNWISSVINNEGYTTGDITYIFCDDNYLHKINLNYLKHDTLTDIISFDYSVGKQIHGEIYISIERVKENAKDFNESFENELKRVIIHGIFHFIGYKDKTTEEEKKMRTKEDEAIAKFPQNNTSA